MARGRKPKAIEELQISGSRHVPKNVRSPGRNTAKPKTAPPRGGPSWLDAIGKA